MQLFSHSKLEKRSYLRMHPFFRKLQKFSIVVSLSKDFRLIKKFITPGGVESCTTLVHITSAFTICFLLCCASGCARQSANLCAHPISADCYLVQFVHKLLHRLPQISWLPISIYHCILQPALPYLCLPRFLSKAKSALKW